MFGTYKIAHSVVDEEYMITDMFLVMPIWYVVIEHFSPIGYEILAQGLTYREAVDYVTQKIKEN